MSSETFSTTKTDKSAEILMTRPTENNNSEIITTSSVDKATIHTSRTIMLNELSTILSLAGPDAEKATYGKMIIDDNVLSKPTLNTRRITAKRLFELYRLDPRNPQFRAMRQLWSVDPEGRPLLAALAACTRDTLFRLSIEFILDTPYGSVITSSNMEHYIEEKMPDRFGPKTLRSVSQNLNSSLTQAGYLSGKVRKRRIQVKATPGGVTYALYLAYLEGNRSERLFESVWARFLDCSVQAVQELCVTASRRGWLDYLRAGGVIEVRFPNLLFHEEQGVCA